MTEKPMVLVVDDEETIRETVSMVLEDEGYAVTRAADGLEALAAIDADGIDLVLSDVVMPHLDGRALARAVMAREDRLPVVLMSASRVESGVPGVPLVPKPFDLDRLLGAVAAALTRSKCLNHGHARER